MSASLEEHLKLLHEKLDRIISLLEVRRKPATQRRTAGKAGTKKHLPLSQDAIAREQERFERLYSTWEAGEELKVVEELDAMNADELRRFADANNLNVTSKTPKQKVMKLIDGRFRERRQLMRHHFNRPSV